MSDLTQSKCKNCHAPLRAYEDSFSGALCCDQCGWRL